MRDSIHNPRGMGAIPSVGVTRFRVWAPHAEGVGVVGDFNDWKSSPLQAEEAGMWSSEIAGAKAGDAYQFEITFGGKSFRKNDAYSRMIHAVKATSVIYDPNRYQWQSKPFLLPAWNELVLYEIHVGTFDGGENGGSGSGTFERVIARLPYLKSLGVNALQIMPLMAFPEQRSWGYDLTNPFAVEPKYGGPDSLKNLVDVAHALGIAVIIDVVINHFGPNQLDLWQYDGWSEAGKGGIYFYNDERSWTPWGENRPDFGRGEVRQYLRDSALLWLEEFRFDGLRMDATLFVRNTRGEEKATECDLPDGWTLMQWINDEVERFFPGRMLIAEDLQRNEYITKPMVEGGLGFHAQWDPAFVYPLRQAITAARDEERSMEEIAHAIEFAYNDDPSQRIIYSDSHDQDANGKKRLPPQIDAGSPEGYFARKRSTLAAGLVLTSPGIPMLFGGQEFLEGGSFRADVSLDWTKLKTHAGIHRLYRDLVHLRRNLFGVTRGLLGRNLHLYHFNDRDKIIGFHRWDRGGAHDDVVVLASFTIREIDQDYRVGFPRGGSWTIRFNSDWKGYSSDFHQIGNPGGRVVTENSQGDGFPFSAAVHLPAYGLIILSQDEAGPAADEMLDKAA